jgi:hypothetical protein
MNRNGFLARTAQGMAYGLLNRAADACLKSAIEVFNAATDVTVIDGIFQILHRSLQATTQSLSGAMLILKGILTNGTSKESLDFILDHLHELLVFIYDLFKPANVIPGHLRDGVNGSTVNGSDALPRRDNPYHELNLWEESNRFAVIYQVQRVALTLTYILKQGRSAPPRGLGDLHMNARLPSDFDKDGNPPPPTYTSKLEGDVKSPPNEQWLFINGIANEFFWFQRSCDKVRDTFRREVKGVYNRSDGILWDLIECASERNAASDKQNEIIERTPSSKAAQSSLEKELTEALWPTSRAAPAKVVMIAHSQGCLILRLVLQKLVGENPKRSQKMKDMKERLRVFTFGNPSIDWRVMSDGMKPLSEYASVTEHFAHEVDFVAMLGVATHCKDRNSGYDRESIFFSKGGRGHLFGAHYSLETGAYENGPKSKLLGAAGGRDIA